MSRLAGILSLLLFTLPVFGAPQGAQAQVQPRPPTAEERLALLERRVQVLNDVLMRLDQLQQEVRQLRGEVELQNNSMEEMKKRQRDLYLDIDQRLSQAVRQQPVTPAAPLSGAGQPVAPMVAGQVMAPDVAPQVAAPVGAQTGVPVAAVAPQMAQAPAVAPQVAQAPAAPPARMAPAPVVPFPAPPAGPQMPADPAMEQGAYQQAFDLLMQRRYAEAKQGFQQFLAKYPSGRLAANAQYWLAEASYVTRDFPVALAEFGKVISQYPNSAKVSDALLKTGYIQYEQQEWEQARKTLQGVVDSYPALTASRLAKKRLDRMRLEGH